MRPFLVYAPGGSVPAGIREQLADVGAETLVASTLAEAESVLARETPDVILVVPPGGTAEAASLLTRLESIPSPPPVFVLAKDEERARPVALEVVPRKAWARATSSLKAGSRDAASTILLTRVQLVMLLELWEAVLSRGEELGEHALRTLSLALDASRVSLFQWKPGEPSAVVVGSSLGEAVVGREVDIVRYPELRAAGARSGPVLVEEIEKDPLMGDASRFLTGVPIRSLLCQRLPGSESNVYVHAVRERVPFGLSDVALTGAAARLLQAAREVRRPRGASGQREKAPESKRLRTLEHVLQGIPEPSTLVSASGEILIVNPAFLHLSGRLESELIGLELVSLLRPPQPQDDFAPSTRIPGTEFDVRRARLATASGDTIPVEVLAIPTSDETFGKAGWSTVTLRDGREEQARRARLVVMGKELESCAKELETLRQTVRQDEAARAGLWTAAAHELRTPLSIAESHLEVVLTDLAAEISERSTALLKTASESLQRLERLIADVLDAAVATHAKTTVRREDVDLGAVLTELSRTLASAAERRGLRLAVEPLDRPARVTGDREKIARLLANLVEHSLRAAPKEHPVVRIWVRRESGRTAVLIADRGPTLSPERAAHLFDDIGSSRGSAEFGLAVARRLAEAMGAELSTTIGEDGANVKRIAWRGGDVGA